MIASVTANTGSFVENTETVEKGNLTALHFRIYNTAYRMLELVLKMTSFQVSDILDLGGGLRDRKTVFKISCDNFHTIYSLYRFPQ
jgi:hypothetical protein